MSAAEILSSGNENMIRLFKEQLIVFPQDKTKVRIHVFQLGQKLKIARQDFEGGAYGYYSLSEIL